MLLNIRIPFKLEDENDHNNSCGHERRALSSTMAHQAGLRIVPQISSQNHHNSHSNYVVLKSALISRQPNIKNSNNNTFDSQFLKTCNLCNIVLRLDKEIYMYRGDQGFCSEECRSKQIYKDEIKELEASTKKMVESYRKSCNNSTSNETRSILVDLINSRETYMNTQNRRSNNRAIFIF